MAEPFKNRLDAALVRQAARHLERAWPAFERRRFEQVAIESLDTLELKARAMHIADALDATLPADFDRAASVVEVGRARRRRNPCTLRKRHALRVVTVRRDHAGRHRVGLRVNGRDLAHADFDLRLPAGA
jgi:hypothetical protein